MRIDPDGNADALGTVKTIGHAAGGAELCVSVVGCSFGVPIMLAGFLDVNLVKLRLIIFLLNRN